MTTLRTALRTFNWRNSHQQFRLLVGALILITLATGGGLAIRLLRPTTPPRLVAGQLLAWDIAETVKRAPGVQLASGAYIPGEALLLYSRLTESDRARVRSWALMQIEPFRERLATMSNGETLTWVIDFGAAASEQEVILAPLKRATDSTRYRYVSAAPEVFTAAKQSATITATTRMTTTAAPVAVAKPITTAVAAAASVVNPAPVLLNKLAFDDPTINAKAWQPLAGDWAIGDGIYSQRQTKGYDFISMLTLEPQTHYQMEAQLRLGEGEMGGGFIYNAPNLDTRRGAQSIDMDRQGGFLRWGRYDDKGNYVYEGGAKIDPPISDGEWHTLQLLTHGVTSAIALDGRLLGQATNRSTSGYLGLTTSQAQVDFDNVTVTALSPTAGGIDTMGATTAVRPASRLISGTQAAFQDDFAAGNVNGWRVLNGTWQFVEQSYQQVSTAGTDLGSISTFQGETYTATVRLRQLDGVMGGGLYFNMAQRNDKMRSQMINYTRNGAAIQWGHFDEGGNFVFEDTVAVPNGGDGAWHTLTVAVQQKQATFFLDQKLLARDVALTYTGGYVGLLVSNSKVAFDDFMITTP